MENSATSSAQDQLSTQKGSHRFYLAKTVGSHYLSNYLLLILLINKLPRY